MYNNKNCINLHISNFMVFSNIVIVKKELSSTYLVISLLIIFDHVEFINEFLNPIERKILKSHEV